MKKTNFADREALTLKESKESHLSESKTNFNYINFWSYINEEFFKEITDKSFYQTEELIYKLSNNGKKKFFISFFFLDFNQKCKKNNHIQKDKEDDFFIPFKIFSQSIFLKFYILINKTIIFIVLFQRISNLFL